MAEKGGYREKGGGKGHYSVTKKTKNKKSLA